MKKRLLSAVLALAIVLTMLPMAVFAEDVPVPTAATSALPESGTTRVEYVYGTDKTKTDISGNYISDAWAWQYKDPTDNKTHWASDKNLSGIVNTTNASGIYYSSATKADGTLNSNNFTVIGSVTISAGNLSNTNSSLNVNTFGGTLNFTGGALERVSNLTVTDTAYTQYGMSRGTVSGVVRDVSGIKNSSGLNLTVTGATVNGISLHGRNNTVRLTDAEVNGSIELNGITTADGKVTANTQSLTTAPKNAYPYTKSVVTGAITMYGDNSRADLKGATVSGALNVTGVGGSVTLSNETSTGMITVATGASDNKGGKPATVTVNDATAGGISYQRYDKTYTGASTFTVGTQGRVTGLISTDNGTVNLTSANVSDVTVKNGTLSVSGVNGSMGGVLLGDATDYSKVTFNFTGTNYTVGDLTKASTNDKTTLVIGNNWPTGRVNTFGALDLNDYDGKAIKGGIFETKADDAQKAAWFSPDLQFVRKEGTKYAYYSTKELAAAIADAGGNAAYGNDGVDWSTSVNHGPSVTPDTVVLSVIGSKPDKAIGFFNSALDADNNKPIANLGFGKSTAIYLPDKINGTPVNIWTNKKEAKPYNVNESVALTASAHGAQLVLQGGSSAVTKLTNVTSPNKYVTVKLTGNQVVLSGAVGQDAYEDITVTFTTDLIDSEGKPVTFNVSVAYNTTDRTGRFSALGANIPNGVIVNNDNIVVGNYTYTLSVSGLVKPASSLQVAGIDSTEAYGYNGDVKGNTIEFTVNVSGMGNSAKQTLIDSLTGDAGTDSVFDWSKSPAMQQLVNQAMTTITNNNQIESWKTAAQRAAWKLDHKGNPTDPELKDTGYNQVVLQPYLAVTITQMNRNGTVTANLVPSYRVLVASTNTTYVDSTNGIARNKTGFTKDGYYIAKAGASLGTPITDLTNISTNSTGTGGDTGTGGVKIKFANSGRDLGLTSATVMHQDGTYAYNTGTAGEYDITRGGKNGLGTVVFNSTPALITMTRTGANVENGTDSNLCSYDNLQAAVDDTLPQADDKFDKITVTAAYTGSGAINVTGTARKFVIKTEGQTTITNSGSNNFTVSVDKTGHEFTVQLQQSIATATGEVEVAVAAVNNGRATVNVNRAKVGSEVIVTLLPNAGYTGSVTAKTNAGTPVVMTKKADVQNTYTFKVPAGATRVDVTPVFTRTAAQSALTFTDVATTDSFYTAVLWNYQNNYIKGTDNAGLYYRPYNNLTRGQLMLILYRNAGSPSVDVVNYYKDMPTYDQEMCRAITWATKNRIVNGFTDQTFRPNNSVRNEQMAKILYTYNVYRGKPAGNTSTNLTFTDTASINSTLVDYVKWAVANNVMTGANGQFMPQHELQRYEAAQYIYNYGMRFGA